MKQPRVAIVGATGAVGQELLRVFEERDFDVSSLKLLASARSAGRTLRFRGEGHQVEAVAADAFRGVDVAFFSAGGDTAAALAPLAVDAGCVVIDNSSAFRMQADVPLVVPEVNADALRSHQGIVANPNCSTIILVLALQPLESAAGLEAVVVSTYQAASGAGQRAMDEMFHATRAVLDGLEPPAPSALAQTLAFNVFPHVDEFMADGYTREEDKLLHEVRKILGKPALAVDATCVRVPVARCHSESVSVRLSRPLSVEDARAAFAAAPGLVLDDEPASVGYPTPLTYAHRDACGVGRVRAGRVWEPGLSFWVVGDQLRKGAALNAVQIAETL
ncbi:MAG: aspartate-semialdehyde dehydrogenase [Planctomycetes bacterium]|nr:aspartate-semialdehyde dehydrogenase [Planctomycetota bacterium]